ncbi:MAG: hypothetical protein ACO1O1_17130 [Adhaeribacter sp.]
MHKFSDLLGENPGESRMLASKWCDHKIEQLPENDWLPWAAARVVRKNLLKLEVAKNIFDFSMAHKWDLMFYVRFVADLSLLCAEFYKVNGGVITDELQSTMESEAREIALKFPEPTKPESKRVELEERDGVTFIKNTNFVLSKLL